THLFAWAYALFSRKKHVPMTDGWLHSERELSTLHRIVRKVVYRTSHAYIAAGKAGFALYRNYGIKDNYLFQSHLCIDNNVFRAAANNQYRLYDVMFSGQIIERKLPDFFVNVVQQVKSRRGQLSVLIIGDGPQRKNLLCKLNKLGVDATYAGFIAQRDLPQHYSKAKMLLFTTRNDPWGIVANEALASGTPVITTPYAGVAHDLVIDGVNGYILDLDPDLWASRINDLLDDQDLMARMRKNAIESVSEFNFENAAQGIILAAKHAYNKGNRT
ncbi:MAG TPA: glycosyltransferase family 4 protein, partial [Geobacteraceae bacterium]|nr:glycosyltransferase family 4 protein [Geobacteraceae bacterium]